MNLSTWTNLLAEFPGRKQVLDWLGSLVGKSFNKTLPHMVIYDHVGVENGQNALTRQRHGLFSCSILLTCLMVLDMHIICNRQPQTNEVALDLNLTTKTDDQALNCSKFPIETGHCGSTTINHNFRCLFLAGSMAEHLVRHPSFWGTTRRWPSCHEIWTELNHKSIR